MCRKETTEIEFHEITSLEDPLLPDYFDLYETAFPPEERIPISHFLRPLLAKAKEEEGSLVQLHTAHDGRGKLLAMAKLDISPRCEAVWLVYFAVNEACRGRGIGTQFFRELVQGLKTGRPLLKALILEVEIPEEAGSAEVRLLSERRIAFYRSLGALRLMGIAYTLRVPAFPEGVPMHLMALPLQPLAPEEAYAMAECLFPGGAVRTGKDITLE